jgi:hypothetical protein
MNEVKGVTNVIRIKKGDRCNIVTLVTFLTFPHA